MVNVFFSYATKDRDTYQIPRLAELLEKKPYIDVVYYWEDFASGSIIEYMNKRVKSSHTCVFFYSKRAASSEPMKKERDMAIYQGKHIIPVFTDINDVPDILKIESGVDASDKTAEYISDKIYHLISRKFKGFEEWDKKINQVTPILKKIIQKRIHASPDELSSVVNADPELVRLCLEKFTIHHKDSNQYWINLEELPKSVISFRDATILDYEAQILLEIESYLHLEFHITKKFELVNKIEYNTKMGFSVKNNRVTGIGLYNCGMTTLPESVGFLFLLKKLGLGDNKLKILPDSIKQLTSIQILILEFNNFEVIPPIVSNLTFLQELYLRHNKITKLSDTIKNLKNLKRLDLGNNNIIEISPESIKNLVLLKSLRLSNNHITKLPETIGSLSSVELIELNNNPLINLPKTIENLKNLKFLYLKGTKIRNVSTNLPNLEKTGRLSIFL